MWLKAEAGASALAASETEGFRRAEPDPVGRTEPVAGFDSLYRTGRGDKILAAKSADNPSFAKVDASMKAFAQRAGKWQNDTLIDYKMAYNHYFGAKKG